MTIFEIVDFKKNDHITIRIKKNIPEYKLFGETTVSYLILSSKEGACRLVVKILIQYTRGIVGLLMRGILPIGDLIMMRRQLLNFKKLSEQTESDGWPEGNTQNPRLRI